MGAKPLRARHRVLPGRETGVLGSRRPGPRWLDRPRVLEERAGRRAQHRRLLLGQGRRAPPGTLPGGGGWGARDPGEHGESRCRTAGLADLGLELAARARRRLWDRARGARRLLPQANDPPGQRRSRGCRRGRPALRVGIALGQEHWEHPQRGRRQRGGLSALRPRPRAIVRIALFITCFNDTLFPGTGRAVVELLERLGHRVTFPEEQTCCGQMHANSGYQREAVPLVRRFVRTFGDAETIVSPSASCVGMVRDQYVRLAELDGDAVLEREVEALAPRVLELSELLVDELG